MSTTNSDRQRDLLQDAERFSYKEIGAGEGLDLFVFSPPGLVEPAPAILFFYGGGFWEGGALAQFVPQALHFASRGCVSIVVDYRLGRERGSSPLDGVEDARDAVAWVSGQAGRLGVDATKLVLGGASCGAFVALASVMDPPPQSVVDRPAGLLLFSPIVNVARGASVGRFGGKKLAKQVSPLHRVRRGLPPVILFHGTEDPDQGISEIEALARKLTRKKNVCELHVFRGERSSFFNFNVDATLYEATLNLADEFLVRLGVLGGGADGAATTRLESWR